MASPVATPPIPPSNPVPVGTGARGIDAVKKNRGAAGPIELDISAESFEPQSVAFDLSAESQAAPAISKANMAAVNTPTVPGRIKDGRNSRPGSRSKNGFQTPPNPGSPVNPDLTRKPQNDSDTKVPTNNTPGSETGAQQQNAPRSNTDAVQPLPQPLNNSSSSKDSDSETADKNSPDGSADSAENSDNGQNKEGQAADQEQDSESDDQSSETPPPVYPRAQRNAVQDPQQGSKPGDQAAVAVVQQATQEQFWLWYAGIIPSFGLTLLYLDGWWLAGHFVKKLALQKKQKLALLGANLIVLLVIMIIVVALAHFICNSPLGYLERVLSFITGRDSFCKPLQAF